MTTTAYPTRAEIDATTATLRRLRSHLGGELVHGLAWSAIDGTLRILAALDDVPGLHYPDAEPEPEPEPKPTAAEVLREAWLRADGDAEAILWPALRYAEAHPEWFDHWHAYKFPSSALIAACNKAERAGDDIAKYVLIAASCVPADHPHLFGGAA